MTINFTPKFQRPMIGLFLDMITKLLIIKSLVTKVQESINTGQKTIISKLENEKTIFYVKSGHLFKANMASCSTISRNDGIIFCQNLENRRNIYARFFVQVHIIPGNSVWTKMYSKSGINPFPSAYVQQTNLAILLV